MKVLIIYFTKTGHTLEAVNAVADGVRRAKSEADIITIKDFSPSILKKYDALIVGSPCWAGSIASGVPKPVRQALEAIKDGSLKGILTGAVSVNGGTGAENTITAIGEILKTKGSKDFLRGPAAKAGSPLSLWKGPSVRPEDLSRFNDFGHQFEGRNRKK